MSHVAPHRWADAALGRVTIDERNRMVAHASTCSRCATARDRITGAREAFGELARMPSPELRWEQVGARVYWASSQERRARERSTSEMPAWRRRFSRRWLVLPALALGASAAAAVYFVARTDDATAPSAPVAGTNGAGEGDTVQPVAPIDDLVAVDLIELAPTPVPVPMTGLVTMAQGDARIGGAASASLFDATIVAGLALETGRDGRLAVQIDAGTAFSVGPSSRLTVARLDQAAIELHVDGEVSVEVAHRAAGQRFAVIAGGRVVEVRGTSFEVSHHGGRVEVACRHGVVAVRDRLDRDGLGAGAAPDQVIEVRAGTTWTASDGEPLTAHAPAPLTAEQLAALIAHSPARMPAWSDPASMMRTTGAVQIAAPRGRAVRVDGIDMASGTGSGSLTVRLMSGRHLVEAERVRGQFGRGEWVATRDDEIARVEVGAVGDDDDRATRRSAVSKRRRQLDHAVDHQRMAGCLRQLAKQGVAEGTHVELEIGVDATGAVSFLNVGSTDLPARTAACVRDVVAEVTFSAGPAATWRQRFSF